MAQRTLDGNETNRHDDQQGETCSEAVMAAMQAISDHCGSDGVPLQMANGMVTMVPKEEMDQIKNMAPADMDDEELMQYVEESPWLRDWTAGLCKSAGQKPGTESYKDCRLQFAREALNE